MVVVVEVLVVVSVQLSESRDHSFVVSSSHVHLHRPPQGLLFGLNVVLVVDVVVVPVGSIVSAFAGSMTNCPLAIWCTTMILPPPISTSYGL